MIQNYIKIAWRNLLKSKGYATINIIGLAIGMAAVLLIGIWIQNQSQFDNFYSNKDNLYRLWNKYDEEGEINLLNITAGTASSTLKAEYPEVEHAARMYWSTDRLLSFDNKKIKSKGNEVDPNFIEMFDFKLLKGNRNEVLNGPNNIILTERLSKKIFGDADPLNKTITLDNKEPYQVTGVIADLPSNTDFDFTYLIPLINASSQSPTWNINTFMTYIQLRMGQM